MALTVEDALSAAWTHCAPNRAKGLPFPRGFWQDVARVACYMMEQQTITPVIPFRPTMCTAGNAPAPVKRMKRGIRRALVNAAQESDPKTALLKLKQSLERLS
jgi:hypothetical protein